MDRKTYVDNLVSTIPERVKILVALEMLREKRFWLISQELLLLERLRELSLRHVADPQKKPGSSAGKS